MIQRVQSLFLIGIVICMVLFNLFLIWEKADPQTGEMITLSSLTLAFMDASGDMTEETTSVWYLMGLSILAGALALYEVFRYDNRLLQIKIGFANTILFMAIIGISIYIILRIGEPALLPDQLGTFGVAFYSVFVAMLFNSFANRFIRRDERLVRSVDRIR
ncbi:DUF4293 domain-containing protein [Roseivirga sp. BDSF3-8]|uniref:DUF4293 domain-containing protein n=1 Tax=Roseivirga sp. BDSF3-8 TaxID=3241598 RepID=UPI003531D371